MNFAIVKDGVVINVAVSDTALEPNWIQDDGAKIGDLWDGVKFTTPAPVPVVPQSVTRFQAKAALHLAGHLTAVEAIMADPATDMTMKLAWQDALSFERTSPTVAAIGVALGLTEEDIDNLFITASGISA